MLDCVRNTIIKVLAMTATVTLQKAIKVEAQDGRSALDAV